MARKRRKTDPIPEPIPDRSTPVLSRIVKDQDFKINTLLTEKKRGRFGGAAPYAQDANIM